MIKNSNGNQSNRIEDSLKKRYFYKLGANIIVMPILIVTATIVPRSLGPVFYGNFTYLTIFFSRVVGFFDSGTSIGFYTKLSQRLNEKGLIKFYWYFVLAVSLILLVFVPLIFLLNKQDLLWPSQSVKYIWMALFFSLLTWYSQIVTQIVDAHGYTTRGEIVKIIRCILGFIIIITLFLVGKLNLTFLFFYHYMVIFILFIGLRHILKANGVSLFPRMKLKYIPFKSYIKEFRNYSFPLITYSFISLLVGVFDVWLLQKFAGSVQQGFYGLAFKISGMCSIFGASMTPLITREFSIAFGNGDFKKMRYLFLRYIPMIYSAIAFVVVFLSINADKVTFLIGGEKFVQAKTAIAIMVLYPLYQINSQLSGSVFYAAGQTKLYRNIGVSIKILGIITVFFFIAPKDYFGLNLGATGLALKMILLQFILANVQLFYAEKYLKISLFKFFSHQIYVVAAFAIICYSSLFITNIVSSTIVGSLLINGVIYIILSLCLLFSFPSIFSLSRKELNSLVLLAVRKSPLGRKI